MLVVSATPGRLGKTVGANVAMFFIYSGAQILGAFLSCFIVFAVYKDEEQYLSDKNNLTTHDMVGYYATWPTDDFEISPVSSHAEYVPVKTGFFIRLCCSSTN